MYTLEKAMGIVRRLAPDQEEPDLRRVQMVEEHMTGWNPIHDHISKLGPNPRDLREMRAMLVRELTRTEKPRHQITYRLLARHGELYKEMKRVQFIDAVKEVRAYLHGRS